MKGMLKAEMFKFRSGCALWVILAVITAACFIAIITGTYKSAEQTLSGTSKDCMVQILSCAVYGAVILTDDFSNGLLRHYVAGGYNRIFIILAKLIHYIFGCGVLLLAYSCLSVSFSALINGIETGFISLATGTLLVFLKTFPLYLGIFGMFFFFAILIKKGAAVTGLSIAVSIILGVFTNKLFKSSVSVLWLSPVVQISEAADGNITPAYFVSVLLSFALLTLFALGSVFVFQKEEI